MPRITPLRFAQNDRGGTHSRRTPRGLPIESAVAFKFLLNVAEHPPQDVHLHRVDADAAE